MRTVNASRSVVSRIGESKGVFVMKRFVKALMLLLFCFMMASVSYAMEKKHQEISREVPCYNEACLW